MDTPSYKPPGYPDFGNMWSLPPQPLPGPDDHPFFKWIAAGANKDPALTRSYSSASSNSSTVTAKTETHQISTYSIIQPQMVFPFVPPPTLTMEPMTPDTQNRSSFLQAQTSPSGDLPGLSMSPTDPSPNSAFTATPSSSAKQRGRLSSDDEATDKSATSVNHEPRSPRLSPHAHSAPVSPEDPECTSMYMMRPLPASDPEVDAQQTLAIRNGQVWRSGSKREGWRRHQWSVDVG